jgi:hypothetical protein
MSFFSLAPCLDQLCGPPTPSYPTGTRGSFPRVKWHGMKITTPLYLGPTVKKEQCYTFTLLYRYLLNNAQVIFTLYFKALYNILENVSLFSILS